MRSEEIRLLGSTTSDFRVLTQQVKQAGRAGLHGADDNREVLRPIGAVVGLTFVSQTVPIPKDPPMTPISFTAAHA